MSLGIEDFLDNIQTDIIKQSADVVKEAESKILRIREGVEKPIITRYKHFNNNLIGGIMNGMIITIAALSGFGKTTILKHIEDDMFNPELNPDCEDYVLLKCNYEMTSFNLLMRRLKETMKTPMKQILSGELDSSQLAKFNDTVRKESHPNIFYIEKPLLPKEWYVNVRQFIIKNQHRKKIIISMDHLGLVKDTGNKKQAMDETLEFQNELKKEFQNVSFINLSQMNRDIESRTDIKTHAPKASDLYNSSNILFVSDAVIALNNGFKLGFDRYMRVPTKRYPHLREYMLDPSRDFTSFETKGLLFWHYLKIRQDDYNPEEEKDETLHIEELYKRKDRGSNFHQWEKANLSNDLPRMEASNELWGDVEEVSSDNEEDEDDMPF